jgi:DNA-binding transcriptional LysR family regulator
VKETVARGAGVGILYHDAIKQEIDRGEFKPVKIPGLDLQRRSYIVYSKEKPLSRVAQEFLALLRDSKAGDSPGETMTLQPQPKLSIATRVHLLRSKPLS